MPRRIARLAAPAAALIAGSAPAQPAPPVPTPVATGQYTYAGKGTVNTHWIETPGGGLVVIDVQRDLAHAREALAAVQAVGKPVRAILITHAHPDHYAGVGLFKKAFPDLVVWASATTNRTIRTDGLGLSAQTRKDEGANFPARVTPPDRVLRRGRVTSLPPRLVIGDGLLDARRGRHGVLHSGWSCPDAMTERVLLATTGPTSRHRRIRGREMPSWAAMSVTCPIRADESSMPRSLCPSERPLPPPHRR